MKTYQQTLQDLKDQATEIYDKRSEDLTFCEVVALFALDPNCAPELWISDVGFGHWTSLKKNDFIRIGNSIKHHFHQTKVN